MLRRVTVSAARGGAVLGICETQGAPGWDPHFRFLCRAAVSVLRAATALNFSYGSSAGVYELNGLFLLVVLIAVALCWTREQPDWAMSRHVALILKRAQLAALILVFPFRLS